MAITSKASLNKKSKPSKFPIKREVSSKILDKFNHVQFQPDPDSDNNNNFSS